jgi:transcriptional regulator with XRE-family HTH domain
MPKSIVLLVAQNLRKAFERSAFDSYRALASAAGVAPNTVKNLVEPESRTPGSRGEVSPRLDNLDKIARAMGYEGWQLMQENFDPTNRPTRVLSASEAEWYRKVEDLYRQLPPDPKNGE